MREAILTRMKTAKSPFFCGFIFLIASNEYVFASLKASTSEKVKVNREREREERKLKRD